MVALRGASGRGCAYAKPGGKILEVGVLIELKFLNGRDKLAGFPVRALIAY